MKKRFFVSMDECRKWSIIVLEEAVASLKSENVFLHTHVFSSEGQIWIGNYFHFCNSGGYSRD